MSKVIKALCLFDYLAHTGFATVSQNLVKNWKRQLGENLNLEIIAINYFGQPFTDKDGTKVISAKNSDNQKDDFGRYVFLKTVLDNDYDILFILQDPAVVRGMVIDLKKIKEDKKAANKKQFKTLFYFPVDGVLIPRLTQYLEFFDFIATYTEFGKKEILVHRPDLMGKIRVIPHGIDTKIFNPPTLTEIITFRQNYFGANRNKFIVANINRNQPRKDIPATIFGFYEYWEKFNKESFLYLHMNPNDPLGWDLRQLLSQLPLVEGRDYGFPSADDYNKGASVEKLRNIYGSCDCYLTTATGGGWELTVTEAMACGLPVILPQHSSFAEIGKGIAYFLEELTPVAHHIDNIIRFQVNHEELSEKLDQVKTDLDDNIDEIDIRITAGLKFVNKLDWHSIAKIFSDEMKRLA